MRLFGRIRALPMEYAVEIRIYAIFRKKYFDEHNQTT